MKKLINYLSVFLLLLFTFYNCSEVDVILPEDANNIEITNTGSYAIETDNGDRGLIINTRQMFHKGYSPQTASISFPNYSRFDSNLDIDEDVNLAIFRVFNDSLSQEEQDNFSEGVMTLIEISGEEGILGTFEGNVVIDDSNIPLSIDTNLDFIPKPINLNSGAKQLLVFKTKWGTLNTSPNGISTINPNPPSNNNDQLITSTDPYNADEGILQGFFFEQIEGNRYRIKLPRVCTDVDGELEDCTDFIPIEWNVISRGGWIKTEEVYPGDYRGRYHDLDDPNGAAVFELVPKENGWMEMYLVIDNSNLIPWTWWNGGRFAFKNDPTASIAEIRLIPDNITYSIQDAGTIYSQPVIPPALLDFAFLSTIRNCSNTVIDESVGRVETKTRTTSVSTTESLELFSQIEEEWTTTIGFEAEVRAGGVEATGGIGTSVQVSGSTGTSFNYTTSSTTSTSNTIEESFSDQIEVSRIRTITVPAYTGVEVFDYIESSENVRIPFVKKMRISGTNQINNSNLSGAELLSVMEGNLFGGLITKVEEESIIISLRGSSLVNSLFIASSGANDIEDPCID